MKQTILAGIVLGLVWLVIGYFQTAKAITPIIINPNIKQNIRLIPSPTPTLAIIKKLIDPNLIKLISTSTPIPTVQPTVNPKLSPTVTPTIAEVTMTPTESPAVTATITAQPTPTTSGGSNMTFWFLMATIGLLAVIIVVQAWPKKDSGE